MNVMMERARTSFTSEKRKELQSLAFMSERIYPLYNLKNFLRSFMHPAFRYRLTT